MKSKYEEIVTGVKTLDSCVGSTAELTSNLSEAGGADVPASRWHTWAARPALSPSLCGHIPNQNTAEIFLGNGSILLGSNGYLRVVL